MCSCAFRPWSLITMASNRCRLAEWPRKAKERQRMENWEVCFQLQHRATKCLLWPQEMELACKQTPATISQGKNSERKKIKNNSIIKTSNRVHPWPCQELNLPHQKNGQGPTKKGKASYFSSAYMFMHNVLLRHTILTWQKCTGISNSRLIPLTQCIFFHLSCSMPTTCVAYQP